MSGHSLAVRRTLSASAEEVFDAWLDSEGMAEWMCPGSISRAEVSIDPRVGGRFRIVMKSDRGEYVHTGEFRVLERPSKLQFTWFSSATDQQETLVTIELRPQSDGCELLLTHDHFPQEKAIAEHRQGWSDILGKLGRHLESHPYSQQDFQLRYEYAAPLEKMYQQFATENGIRNWWTIHCDMEERVGGRASFRFPSSGFFAAVRIARLDAPKMVEWDVIECDHPPSSGFVDLHDWVGTRIRFELEPASNGGTRLLMTHARLALKECLGVCSSAWAFFLNQSLRGYVETGRGDPHTK